MDYKNTLDVWDEVRQILDSRVNCHTAEYDALDAIERAMQSLIVALREDRETNA